MDTRNRQCSQDADKTHAAGGPTQVRRDVFSDMRTVEQQLSRTARLRI